MTIEPMNDTDRTAVHTLLRSHGLPLDGFDAPHVEALVAREGDRVIGSAALERYDGVGLLRSVAVNHAWHGQGVGQRLTAEILALARRRQMEAVYLLTETAAGFFPKLGFVAVPRDEVPAALQGSVEFTTACPASAQAMVLRL